MESVKKYLAGKTTMAIETRVASELLLPVITLCPGFKPGAFAGVSRQKPVVSFFDVQVREEVHHRID